MHRRHLLGVALLAAIASKPSGAVEAARLPVIATFSILGDMVATVGGLSVEVRTLVGPDQDVHIYEPTPKDLRDLLASAAVFENGLGLEGWMARLTGAAGFKGRIIQAGAKVTPRTMKEDSGAIATDPHAWQNPRNGVLYVQAVSAGLSRSE